MIEELVKQMIFREVRKYVQNSSQLMIPLALQKLYNYQIHENWNPLEANIPYYSTLTAPSKENNTN